MQIGMFVLCSIDSVLFTQPQSTVCHLDELHFECENATSLNIWASLFGNRVVFSHRWIRHNALGVYRVWAAEYFVYDTCVNYLVLRSAVFPYPSARNPQIVNIIKLKSQTWNSITASLWCDYPFWLFFAFCRSFYSLRVSLCPFTVNLSSSNFRQQFSLLIYSVVVVSIYVFCAVVFVLYVDLACEQF